MARNFESSNTEKLVNASATVPQAYPISIACWHDIESTGTTAIAFAIGVDSAANWFGLGINPSALGGVYFNNGTGYGDWTGALSTSTWYHAAARLTSSDVEYYSNGVGTGTPTSISGACPAYDTVCIGDMRRNGGYGNAWDGNVAEAAIWEAELSDDNFAELATGVSPLMVRPDALVFYSPCFAGLTAGGGGDEWDWVANHTLTDTNTVTVADHPTNIIHPYPRNKVLGVRTATVPPHMHHYLQQQSRC